MHLIHVPTPGDHYSPATGSAPMTIIYNLTRVHQERGHDTTLVVGRGTRHDYPVGHVATVPFPPLPSRAEKAMDVGSGRLGLRRRFVQGTYRPALDAIPGDFDGTVVLHNAPGALRLFRERLPRARVVLYAHNELFRTYGPREAWRTLSEADTVICNSRFLADRLQSRLPRRLRSVSVVVNGVDVDLFQPRQPAATSGPPVILMVARVVPEKGAHLLLEAAVKIADPGRPFRIRIVGSSGFSAIEPLTAYEQHLRRLAAPIADRVEFQPFVDRAAVLEEYARATIGCVPSEWDEPCSLTLPEAMAAGLPVVASRRGGLPEVGADSVLWFTPPDTDALAEHLAVLLDEAEQRDLWGRRARERALQLSWERQYDVFRAALEGDGA